MSNTFHYIIMAEHAIFQKELLAKVKGSGLTIGQPKILDYLREHDGVNQKEIAKGCFIEPGTLTTLLNRMEENGLVERRMLNGNRRSFYIFLTPKGREKADLTAAAFLQLEERVFSGITEEKRKNFMELFLQIYQNSTDIFFEEE